MITDEMILYEFGDSAADGRWSRWVDAVEKLLGHDLDGDQDTDGYSLDCAYEAWNRGEVRITPEEYVAIVHAAKAGLAKAEGVSRCADCDACARHAYSDATTPGFFYNKCEKHRVKAEGRQ
jgi:hypothetical protein